MLYWFCAAPRKNSQTGQLIPYPAGVVSKFVVNFPGPREGVMAWAKSLNLGTRGMQYMVIAIPPNDPTPMVLAYEINGAAQGAAQPNLSAQHVQGGQPMGAPVVQPGNAQQHASGFVDAQSGFQTLGSDALDAGGDALYGSADEGTWSDLYNQGGRVIEQPRQV